MFSLFLGAHLIFNNYYVTAAEPTRVSSGPQEILSFTTTPHPPPPRKDAQPSNNFFSEFYESRVLLPTSSALPAKNIFFILLF